MKTLVWNRQSQFFCLVVMAACLLLIGIPSTGLAEDKNPEDVKHHFELDEIVVTGTRVDDEVRSIPKNVTVITSEEIEQAPSNNVVDLLAREANVNLRSYFGHDKWGGVDIRGMGDTFVSNVLIMVDGVRLNPPDLAGPDLSSIPLDQISRIEILRGSGAVLYGDGAVGGVVNIITKKGASKPELRARASYGSFETADTRLSYGGRVKQFQFNVSGAYYESSGYRDNGRLRKEDASVYAGYDVSDRLSVFVSAAGHRDRYGLPGPVGKADVNDGDRRKRTSYPNDWGETEDQRYRGGFTLDLSRYGLISVQVGHRKRDNEYIMGYSSLLPETEQRSNIDEDSDSLNAGYVKDYHLGGLKHRFQFGFDYFYSDYIRTEMSTNRRYNSEINRYGLYVLNKWSLPHDLALHAGYRHSQFNGTFRRDDRQTFGTQKRWVNGAPFEKEWEDDAFDIGLVYSPNPRLDFYTSYATSFRTPNTDEFALADLNLRPQKGEHIELGVRSAFSDRAEVSLSLYQIRIKDEIYYGEDPTTGTSLNRNYDQRTIRRGFEAEVKLYLTDRLYGFGNIGFVDARFEDSNDFVPLVPDYNATLGLEWRVIDPLTIALTGTFVGDRYDGNDQTNELYDKLRDYSVFDAKLTYEYRNLRVFCGVNNIFDEMYSTVGYSETYYPMPGRNIYAGFEIRI